MEAWRLNRAALTFSAAPISKEDMHFRVLVPGVLFLVLGFTFAIAQEPPARLDFKVNKIRDEKESSESSSTETTVETWRWDVEIFNKNFKDAKDLRVEYRSFVFKDSGRPEDRKLPMERHVGSTTIDSIAGNKSAKFKTDPVEITKTELKANWRYTDPRKRERTADSLKGIWLRVYQNDKHIAEYAFPEGLNRREEWDR
jgi:hypothetical protein